MKNNQISEKFIAQLDKSEIFYLQKAFEDTQVQEIIARKKVPFFMIRVFMWSMIIIFTFIPIGMVVEHQFHVYGGLLYGAMIMGLVLMFVFMLMRLFFGDETKEEKKLVFNRVLGTLSPKINIIGNNGESNQNFHSILSDKLSDFSLFSIGDYGFYFFNNNFFVRSSWKRGGKYSRTRRLVQIKMREDFCQGFIELLGYKTDREVRIFAIGGLIISMILLYIDWIANIPVLLLPLWIMWFSFRVKKDSLEDGMSLSNDKKFIERFYLVTADKVEANKILNEHFCQLLVDFQEKTQCRCDFVFFKSEIGITIEGADALFTFYRKNPTNINTYVEVYIFMRDLQKFISDMVNHLQKVK